MYGLAARRLASGTETSTDFDATMLQSPWTFRFRSKVLLYSPRHQWGCALTTGNGAPQWRTLSAHALTILKMNARQLLEIVQAVAISFGESMTRINPSKHNAKNCITNVNLTTDQY